MSYARGSFAGFAGLSIWMLVLAAPAAAQPDLSGVWSLDIAASDTLALTPSDTAQAKRSGFRIGAGARYGGFPPQSRSIRDPGRMRDAVSAVNDPAERLFIAQDGSTLTISFDAAPPLTVHADGRKIRRVWLDQHDVQVRARWDDGNLRIERVLESQVEITDTYERNGSTLTVTTVVEGPIIRRIALRRVYTLTPSP